MHTILMIRALGPVTVALLLLPSPDGASEPARRTLEYAPAPVDNPLKGLVPYAGDVRDRFPHSLARSIDTFTDHNKHGLNPFFLEVGSLTILNQSRINRVS